MKKLLLYIASILAMSVLVMLIACTKNEDATSNIVKLKGYFIGATPRDMGMVQEKINEYTRKKYNLEIEMKFIDFGDFSNKAKLIINTGEDYDIIFTSSWANQYTPNVRKGAFLDLTSYLQSNRYASLYKVIDPGFWEGAQIDGKIYAVPTQKEIALMTMYLFNKAFVKEAKFDYTAVKKLRDIEPYLKYVKENKPNAIPFLMFKDRTYRGPYDYTLGFGYPVMVNENNKAQFYLSHPDVLDYLTTMRDFFKKGYINQDASTKSGGLEKQAFGLSIADGQPYAEIGWSLSSGFDIVTTEVSTPLVTTSSTRGAMLAINKNSKHPKAALDFMQALNTDSDFHNLIDYGIEGVHYTKVSDTQIKRTERGLSSYPIVTFGLGNLFNTFTQKGEPEDKWKVFKQVNASTKRSSLLGLTIDTEAIKNELAAIANLGHQYEAPLVTGSVDVEKAMTEYKRKLDEVGFQRVLDEVQKQVDAFLSK